MARLTATMGIDRSAGSARRRAVTSRGTRSRSRSRRVHRHRCPKRGSAGPVRRSRHRRRCRFPDVSGEWCEVMEISLHGGEHASGDTSAGDCSEEDAASGLPRAVHSGMSAEVGISVTQLLTVARGVSSSVENRSAVRRRLLARQHADRRSAPRRGRPSRLPPCRYRRRTVS